MQHAKSHDEWEHELEDEPQLLGDTDLPHDDGPEFSSEPMPAAFSACLFLGVALLICALFAIFW